MSKLEEVEALSAEAVDGARQSLPEGHWYTGLFPGGHDTCLTKLKRYDEAETALLEAQGILETAFAPDHERTIKVTKSLADLYVAWGKSEQAAERGPSCP